MPYPYEHLNRTEREQIALRKRQGISQRAMAQELKRSAATISREIRRNGEEGGIYRARWAHRRAWERRHQARRPRKLRVPKTRKQVENGIKNYWSPEQISGRRKVEGAEGVSRTTIYRYIQQERPELRAYLRGSPKRRRYQRIRGQRMIEERPLEVDRRERVGDWESDTLRGPMHTDACLATHVERKTYYLVSRWMKRRHARSLNEVTIEAMKALPVHTLTVDHGMEFGCFGALEAALGAKVYFAHKKCPWERARNEHTNRLMRQFFPRGTDFTLLSPADVRRVQELLNNRPRKALGYRTPKEMMQQLGVALVT